MVCWTPGFYSQRRIPCTCNSHRSIYEFWSLLSLFTFKACLQPSFNRIMQNRMWHISLEQFFIVHQIALLPCTSRSYDLSPIELMWSMISKKLAQHAPSASATYEFWQRVEASCSDKHQEFIQRFFKCRGVWLEFLPRMVATQNTDFFVCRKSIDTAISIISSLYFILFVQ